MERNLSEMAWRGTFIQGPELGRSFCKEPIVCQQPCFGFWEAGKLEHRDFERILVQVCGEIDRFMGPQWRSM